jgi:hypothetical protein
MANQVVTSGLFKVDFKDLLKGVAVAATSGVVSALYSALTTVPLSIDFKQMGVVALTAGLGYLLKNFFTPAKMVSSIESVDDGLSDPDKPKPSKPAGEP